MLKTKVVLLIGLFTVVLGVLYTSDPVKQQEMWMAFKQKFDKAYTESDDQTRFGLFIAGLKQVDALQAEASEDGANVLYGLTPFSDWSKDEFVKFLKFIPSQNISLEEVGTLAECNSAVTSKFVDWTPILPSPVLNQRDCKAGWAFAAVEQIEVDVRRVGLGSHTYSVEQLVECVAGNNGCKGGKLEPAFNYLKFPAGLQSAGSYPYSSGNGFVGQCKANPPKQEIYLQSWSSSLSGKEGCMAHFVQVSGTLAIAVDARKWQFYKGGIMTNCDKNVVLNHAVQIVGVFPVTRGGYWKIRNSWGPKWGESGFIRLAYGNNACGLARQAYFTQPAKLKPTCAVTGYRFNRGFYSDTHRIAQNFGRNIGVLAAECNKRAQCKGFNTNGWLQSEIPPASQWKKLDDPAVCEGLYVKQV